MAWQQRQCSHGSTRSACTQPGRDATSYREPPSEDTRPRSAHLEAVVVETVVHSHPVSHVRSCTLSNRHLLVAHA
eukprot:28323-Eustigmatos_ZCMA.PRE.1